MLDTAIVLDIVWIITRVMELMSDTAVVLDTGLEHHYENGVNV